jgi:outer membrane biosynthesis protein TonB
MTEKVISVRSLLWFCVLLLAVSSSVFFSPQSSSAQQEPVVKRRLVDHVAPAYPALARSMALAGIVKVEALVAADGSVKAVEAKGGHPVLA